MIALVFALYCAASTSVAVTTLAKGEMSAIDEAREVVVRDGSEWSTLWKQHNWNDPPPRVDFAAQTVLGVFLGSRPTAGYSVEITKATLDGGTLVVEYVEHRPAARDITAQVLTMPFHLVSVPVHKGPVRFVRAEASRD
jgi:hypothetical protein